MQFLFKRYPKDNSSLAQFYDQYKMRYVSFLLVHINVTVQNQITTTIMSNNRLVKILLLQHLPHHHCYKAYKQPLGTLYTKNPFHLLIFRTRVKQTHLATK